MAVDLAIPDYGHMSAAESLEETQSSVIERARLELGDISHPFMIDIVGDGNRDHFRLEHRPVDLKSVVVKVVDYGRVHTPPPTQAYEPEMVKTKVTGAFGLEFSPDFDILRVEIEKTGGDPTRALEQTREFRAGLTMADYDDGEHVLQIAVGVFIDVDAGQVVFSTAPAEGSIYRIEGRKWRYFTDEDYGRFLSTAGAQLGHNRANSAGGAWGLGDLDPVEEYPLALLVTIQALWALATDASFDIDILAPDGVNIPRSERFRQLMEMIGARQTQFDELAQALNIGVGRLETYTTRRVAKMTNRLVPVWLSREFDDWSKPKRVILEQNLLGTTAVETIVGTCDIDLYSGYPWQMVVDIGCSLAGDPVPVYVTEQVWVSPFADAFSRDFGGEWEERQKPDGKQHTLRWRPEAVIRKNRGAPYGPPLRTMRCDVIDAEHGLVLLSLTTKDTRYLPYNAFWELQLRPDDGRTPLPVLGGMIRASITEVVL